ncbi:MAG: hypothetical protein JW751_21855 [Polyangiaceae bacterium]|nr:hypothetical protein [Polyangiaceae bacterium]
MQGFSDWVGALLLLVAGCGGATSVDPEGEGAPWSGGTPGLPLGGAGGRRDAGLDVGGDVVVYPEDVRSDYVAPECPETPAPPVAQQCDPFAAIDTCPMGTACAPFVEYPPGDDPCARERYGTTCLPYGGGLQGDPCEYGTCSAGYLCVLTGAGTQCVELCNTLGANTCEPGRFCEPIDVQPGIGGCY